MVDTSKYLSPLVSCLECREVKSAKGIFSHFITAHTEEGIERCKTNGKKFGIAGSKHNKSKSLDKKLQYEKSPNFCGACNIALSYSNRNSKFCSHSCAATNTNKVRIESGWSLSELSRSMLAETIRNKPKRPKKMSYFSYCAICDKCFEGYNRTVCSPNCFSEYMRLSAFRNKLGETGQRSGRIEYTLDSFNNKVRLESSYESRVAKLLNNANINWVRPKPISYKDESGANHRYYPDFYLVDYNLYLDPKNKHLIVKDSDKIKRVMNQNNVQIEIISVDNINAQYINNLIFGASDTIRTCMYPANLSTRS